jgi:hypothetical protein
VLGGLGLRGILDTQQLPQTVVSLSLLTVDGDLHSQVFDFDRVFSDLSPHVRELGIERVEFVDKVLHHVEQRQRCFEYLVGDLRSARSSLGAPPLGGTEFWVSMM